jgi:hypothetical protein
MADAWAKGAGVFLAKWFGFVWELIGFAASQAFPVAVLAAFVGGIALRERLPLAALRPAVPIVCAGLYVSAAVLGFYACVGWVVDRLAYPIVPPLLLAAAAAALAILPYLSPRGRRVLTVGTLLGTVAQVCYVVWKVGPWS